MLAVFELYLFEFGGLLDGRSRVFISGEETDESSKAGCGTKCLEVFLGMGGGNAALGEEFAEFE